MHKLHSWTVSSRRKPALNFSLGPAAAPQLFSPGRKGARRRMPSGSRGLCGRSSSSFKGRMRLRQMAKRKKASEANLQFLSFLSQLSGVKRKRWQKVSHKFSDDDDLVGENSSRRPGGRRYSFSTFIVVDSNLLLNFSQDTKC